MNIFELYLDKIKSIVVELSKKNQLIVPESFNVINAEKQPPNSQSWSANLVKLDYFFQQLTTSQKLLEII